MEQHNQTLYAVYGALVHDLGKILYRAGESGSHSESGYKKLKTVWNQPDILDCIRYHHADTLKSASLSKQSPAYVVYIADNIASATDRREKENVEEGGQPFKKHLPLSSIFNLMHENPKDFEIPLEPLSNNYARPIPSGEYALTQQDYQNVANCLLQALRGIPPEPQWMNTTLSVLETWTSSIPSSTSTKEYADVSLYDHQKITAATAACISEYLLEHAVSDYQQALVKQGKKFWDEKAFLLYSADVSGIQNFIYTVSTDNALRSMRSRSFFLEFLMEHYIDEVLDGCGLSRANLLYSGGGHCYMLLPNTQKTKLCLAQQSTHINRWLREQFGIRLFLADGMTPCSANELTNQPQKDAPYKEIFRRVSQQISYCKMHRYSAAELMELNRGTVRKDGRECKICGAVEQLNGEKCHWCNLFEQISRDIQDKRKTVFVVSETPYTQLHIELPHGDSCVYLSILETDDAQQLLQQTDDVLRVYTKNAQSLPSVGARYASQLFVGEYHDSNRINELAEKSTGISRIAVCRMDVDDLGKAFISGFERPHAAAAEDQYKYVTISRTASFSRQMSRFFKYYINSILARVTKDALAVTIVYSGGDDVFLVGAWDHILEAAMRIQEDFQTYTCHTLHLSAGILLKNAKYPIRRSASEAAELEAFAKSHDGKNAVTIFEASAQQTYPWQIFQDKVINEKKNLLERFFANQEDAERGKAFLYRLLDLLRNSEQRINLARFAYLLARLEPKKNNPSYAMYAEFSKQMYQWYRNPTDRQQLITAIYIYVYQTRTKGDTDRA